MIPNPAEVVRRQWTITGLYRMGAAVLFVLAALCFSGGFVFAISLSMVEGWRRDDVLFSLFFSFLSGGALAVVGLLLHVFARKLGRNAARYPESVPCPRCFYGLEGLVEPRCSECGLDLTPEFLPGSQLRPGLETTGQVLIRHRLVFAPIVRLLAVLLAFPLAALSLPLVIVYFEAIRRNDSIFDEPSYVVSCLWWFGAAVVVLSAIVFPRLWARWLVPRGAGDQIEALGGSAGGSGGGPGGGSADGSQSEHEIQATQPPTRLMPTSEGTPTSEGRFAE